MNKEQIVAFSDMDNPSLRRRSSFKSTTPAYDFRNTIVPTDNATKSTINTQPNLGSITAFGDGGRLSCKLPSKKEWKLQIVTGVPKIRNKNKSTGREVKKAKSISASKPVQKKSMQSQDNLLAKFLLAFEQLQNDERTSKEGVETYKKESQPSSKPNRRLPSQQHEEKWIRFYTRAQELTAQLDSIGQNIILLN